MYEEFFALQRRPFAVTPDPGCWHHEPPFQPALDELVVCAEQGQGIGVLVAPAGAGKTLVCERLARELRDQFATAMLRHATFSTRRALLQSLLCELDRPFDKLTDQELRLGVTTRLKELHASERALVLIVDEAHQLPEAVLDELRILADQAIDGLPLVRLILAGQLSLEEKLALPGAQALNQRIRAHVVLPTLTQVESADYIDYRITWAGGRTAELFTVEALTIVCRAADGLPRCMNQLCDHALLLAYVKEERPVTDQTVLEALSDLSHLPLPWNPVHERSVNAARAVQPPEVSEILDAWDQSELPATNGSLLLDESSVTASIEPPMLCESVTADEELPVYHLSHQLDESAAHDFAVPVFADATPPLWNADTPLANGDECATEFCEELVVDRYTALDAGLEPPAEPPRIAIDGDIPLVAAAETLSAWWSDSHATQELTERLAAVQHVLNAVAETDDEPLPELPRHATDKEDALAVSRSEQHIADSIFDLAHGTRQWIEREPARPAAQDPETELSLATATDNAVFEFGAEIAVAEPTRPEPTTRSCRNLFTLLRRKQQGRL